MDDDFDIIAFLQDLVSDDSQVGTYEFDNGEIFGNSDGQLLAPKIVALSRQVFESARLDPDYWFDGLISALKKDFKGHMDSVDTGEEFDLRTMMRATIGNELLSSLADLAGSQLAAAMEIVANRDKHDALLCQSALKICKLHVGDDAAHYYKIKKSLTKSEFYQNQDGKALAEAAGRIPHELDSLIASLNKHADRRECEFAIDILEEHPDRAADIVPPLKTIAADKSVYYFTREMALSALATLGQADHELEKGLVQFVAPFADDADEGIRAVTMTALGVMRRNPQLSVPVLIRGLDDHGNCSDFRVGDVALYSLLEYGQAFGGDDAIARRVRILIEEFEGMSDWCLFDAEFYRNLVKIAPHPGPVLEALVEFDTVIEKWWIETREEGDDAEDWPVVVECHAELKDAIRRIQGSAGP